jgi:hypothetical protein
MSNRIKTENSDLVWNPHPRDADGRFIPGGRLEGTYRGIPLEMNVVYQGDGHGEMIFGHSLTPGVFTGTWMGYVDTDGEPIFRHVDDHSVLRAFRCATWFDRLCA